MVRHIALVSRSKAVSPSVVTAIAAALQKQVTRDFSPLWGIPATVSYFATLHDVPVGYWPVIIMDTLDDPNAGGYHTDRNGQPYALIRSDGAVSVTASHECLEMLVDPSGNRLIAGDSIKPGQGRVQYLVEVCDPCESEKFAYPIDGLPVSDFYTPHFFDPLPAAGVRYSFTGAVTKPRQLLKGGYISWLEPISGEMWQALYFGARITFRNLGRPPRGKSLREWVEGQTEQRESGIAPPSKGGRRLLELPAAQVDASRARAHALQEDIARL